MARPFRNYTDWVCFRFTVAENKDKESGLIHALIYQRNLSIPNPLHVLKQNLLAAAVIEFRSPAVGAAGDSLSGFESAVIFEKIRDACRAE
jgi:hypothetical protein